MLMKKTLRWALSFVAIFVLLLIILGAVCFKQLDTMPYQQTEFYKKEMSALDSVFQIPNPQSQIQNLLEMGWSRVNLAHLQEE
jgi:hypothetical protein